MSQLWNHLNRTYEFVAKRSSVGGRENYLNEIKSMIPDSDKRLRGFFSSSFFFFLFFF